MIKDLWYRLFLVERPSISLSAFRLAVAFTVGAVMLPTFFNLGDTYLLTAYKEYNTSFFPIEFIKLVAQSPGWLIHIFVAVFVIFWFLFFIGLWSQFSCIVMTMACYYFYALNDFAMATLSWDILLVTIFLMCLTPYHGDYFSVDCLLKGKEDAYKTPRPYFIQRLLQVQVGFTFFFTALVKIVAGGNWLRDNPIYYIMNYPPAGTTKLFLIRDYLRNQPELCYTIGILIVMVEISMVFFLFWRKTRISAIYLGIVFHIALLLILDVPATFFFLFPPMLFLFINPQDIVNWIEQKRLYNQAARQSLLIYDGNCQFCLRSVITLKVLDLFGTLKYVDLHAVDLELVHPGLNKNLAMSQLHLVETDGKLYGGFMVFRRICFSMPMLYPLIFIFYFPGMGIGGPLLYRFIAKNRYLFHSHRKCRDNACFRH